MFLVSNRERFADWLRKERTLRGWSQNELAIRAGIARGIINKTEAGENDPAPKTLQALARAFGYAVDELYRVAGFLPEQPAERPLVRRLLNLLNQLDDDDLEVEEAAIRARIERKQERDRRNEKTRGRRTSES